MAQVGAQAVVVGAAPQCPGSPLREAQQWHSDARLLPQHSGPLGEKAAGWGVLAMAQRQKPPPRGAVGPQQDPVQPSTRNLCVTMFGFLVRVYRLVKHQPTGLSGARLQNPHTHSPGSTSATSMLPRPCQHLPRVTAASWPHFSPLCHRRGPPLTPGHPSVPRPSLFIPACQPPVEPQIRPQPAPGMVQGCLPLGLRQTGLCSTAFTYIYFSHLWNTNRSG